MELDAKHLEPYANLTDLDHLLSTLKGQTDLPGQSGDPEEFFLDLLLDVENHVETTRKWGNFLHSADQSKETSITPRAAVTKLIHHAQSKGNINAQAAALLAEAYAKMGRQEAATTWA